MRFSLSKSVVALPIRAWVEEWKPIPLTPSYEICGDYAVVSISGPLEQNSGSLFENYPCIYKKVLDACKSESKAVCLKLDSPGGDFSGCLELSRELKELCKTYKKKLVAFTDSSALSAAYALAVAADEIVITESAFVGSIGVWSALVDVTAADKMIGQHIVIVPSGSRKADRNPHVPISEETIATMQRQVDDMASLFFSEVATRRNLSVESVKAIQGAEVFGQAAVDARLANRIVGSWNAFITEKVKIMGKYADALAAMSAAAEGDDEDAEMAKKALSSMKGKSEDPMDEKEKDEPKMKKKAEKEEKEMDEDKEQKAAALSPTAFKAPTVLELAAQLHALQVERAQEKEAVERSTLLGKRPDFSAEVRASLLEAPIEFVRKAVATWTRVPVNAAAVDAVLPGAIRGNTQVSTVEPINDEDSAMIDMKMGLTQYKGGVVTRNGGRELELGFMSPDEVLKALAAKNGVK